MSCYIQYIFIVYIYLYISFICIYQSSSHITTDPNKTNFSPAILMNKKIFTKCRNYLMTNRKTRHRNMIHSFIHPFSLKCYLDVPEYSFQQVWLCLDMLFHTWRDGFLDFSITRTQLNEMHSALNITQHKNTHVITAHAMTYDLLGRTGFNTTEWIHASLVTVHYGLPAHVWTAGLTHEKESKMIWHMKTHILEIWRVKMRGGTQTRSFLFFPEVSFVSLHHSQNRRIHPGHSDHDNHIRLRGHITALDFSCPTVHPAYCKQTETEDSWNIGIWKCQLWALSSLWLL